MLLCGTGQRGLDHIGLISGVPGLRRAALHDICATQLQRAAEQTDARPSTDLDALLEAVRPDIVVIATPPSVRLNLAERVAAHPEVRAIVVEKPLALTLEEADEVLKVCSDHDVQLAVFHQLPFCDEFARLRTAIGEGELGDLHSLHAYCYGNLFDQGSHMADLLRWLMPNRKPEWVMAQGWQDARTIARFADLPPTFGAPSIHRAPRGCTR